MILFAGTLILSLFAAAAPGTGEIEEIKKFAAQGQRKGPLLNPPRGGDADVGAAAKYLRSVIEELSGRDLKTKGVHYVVNIYGNDGFGAWVQRLDGEGSPENEWRQEHAGENWPLRKAWGIPDDGRPVYEIGLSTGLLRKLDNKDQLAFVLGRETAHILEGHADSPEYKSAYEYGSEIYQRLNSHLPSDLAADHLALHRLTGTYELEAALAVVEKAYPREERPSSLRQAVVTAALGGAQDEGVRISSLQYNLESLRRTHVDAGPRPTTALPAGLLRLNVHGRAVAPEIRGDAGTRNRYFELVDRLVREPGLEIFKDDASRTVGGPENFDGLFGSPNTSSYAELLLETARRLDAAPGDKVAKMNAFFKSMVFLGSRAGFSYIENDTWLSSLNDAERHELTRFLLRQSVGDGAWTPEDFAKLSRSLNVDARKYIESPFLFNDGGLKILERLVQTSPNWARLVDGLSNADSFLRGGRYEMEALEGLRETLSAENAPKSPLLERYRANLLNSLTRAADERLLAKTTDAGIAEFLVFEPKTDPSQSPEIKQWNANLGVWKSRVDRRSQRIYVAQLMALLNGPANGEIPLMGPLISSIDFNALEPSALNSVKSAYEGYMRDALQPDRELRVESKSLSPAERLLAAKLMARNDRAESLLALRYLFTFESPLRTNLHDFPREVQDALRDAVGRLSKDDFFRLAEEMSPVEKEVRAEVDAAAKKFNAADADELMRAKTPSGEGSGMMRTMAGWRNSLGLNYQLQLNLLQFAAFFGPEKNPIFASFGPEDLDRLLTSLETAKRYKGFELFFSEMTAVPSLSAASLFEAFIGSVDRLPLEKKVATYERVLRAAGPAFVPTVEQETHLRTALMKDLNALPAAARGRWLRKESLQTVLGAEDLGRALAEQALLTAGGDRRNLSAGIERLLAEIPLREKRPDAFVVFRNSLAEKSSLQPSEIATVFPEERRTNTQKIEASVGLIQGMSGFSTIMKALPPADQLDLIEFIMGRAAQPPKALTDLPAESRLDANRALFKLREELSVRTPLERSMMVNTALAGPNGLLAESKGLETLRNHLLKAVPPENKTLAEILLKGLGDAEGRNRTLIFSYALAQKTEGNASLSEATLLRSLLDFYGVPGVKLAQYLAFTSEFKSFQPALEAYQDAAMPISYFDALLLLNKRLGDKWDPARYQVVRIIGSGSVNIAIEYKNLQTGKNDVVSIAREDIETKTREDFRRFRALIAELTRTPELKRQFGFVTGLMDVIEKSVTLEFDKKNSFFMQKGVQELYRRQVDGWNIRTVEAYSVEGMAILMEKAPGVGARKILKTDPATYESAMRAFMRIEYGVLRGVDQTQNWNPVPLHANPDIHDGQIMIDVPNRTVTVLDFGQAVQISNQERELGLDLLRIISKAESPRSALALLNHYARTATGKPLQLTEGEMGQLLGKADRMDIFVHLLSTVDRAGFKVPLATVHWVLAANRLIKLGEKVRTSPESSLKWMLGMRKVGLPLSVYNASKAAADKARDLWRGQGAATPPVNCHQIFGP